MGELLLEIGCEEIPAAMIPDAVSALKELLVQELKNARIRYGQVKTYSTPRRLAVVVKELASRQEDLVETITGPPLKVAIDAEGKYTKAAEAFAAKHQVPVTRLVKINTPKGDYLGLVKRVKGERSDRVIAAALPKVLASIPFPKSMYWTEDKFRFVRPIRWIVALFDGRPIKFEVAGVKASNRTSGHRLLGRSKLTISDFSSYMEAMRSNYVVVDPEERRRMIVQGLNEAASELGGSVLEDGRLLDLVVNLNEYPTVISGSFDRGYLALPQEVLVTVMREHQKYFSVTDGNGKLLPYFLAVINTDGDRTGRIRLGHERVLRARLADAQFFYQTDQKLKLAERRHMLKAVLFQEKLGSYYDKSERVKNLCLSIADRLARRDLSENLAAAASLCKVDLTTEMVKEFPNLQGIMGGIYARNEGYPEAVCRAIYEHYMPRNIEEPSPGTTEGAILSLADKLDSIVGCFAVGLIPSGSKDPFAVRRQANGVIKIIVDHQFRLSLSDLLALAIGELAALELKTLEPEELRSELMRFFDGRVRYVLEARGFRYDEINAAMAVGYDQPFDLYRRAKALADLRSEPDFEAIATAFKRVKNMIRDVAFEEMQALRPELLLEPAEVQLHGIYARIKPQLERLASECDYYGALKLMASMREAVDKFFDEVLVMCEDENLRRNRLLLLSEIAAGFSRVADISELQDSK